MSVTIGNLAADLDAPRLVNAIGSLWPAHRACMSDRDLPAQLGHARKLALAGRPLRFSDKTSCSMVLSGDKSTYLEDHARSSCIAAYLPIEAECFSLQTLTRTAHKNAHPCAAAPFAFAATTEQLGIKASLVVGAIGTTSDLAAVDAMDEGGPDPGSLMHVRLGHAGPRIGTPARHPYGLDHP